MNETDDTLVYLRQIANTLDEIRDGMKRLYQTLTSIGALVVVSLIVIILYLRS